MIEPKIDDLLAAVDSKYTLVILAAKRAREINSYYSQLGEGRAEFIPPLVEPCAQQKQQTGREKLMQRVNKNAMVDVSAVLFAP